MITISKTIKKAACAVLTAALLVTGVVVPKKVEAAGADGVWIEGFSGMNSNIKLQTRGYNIIGNATASYNIKKIRVEVVRDLEDTAIQSGEWPATSDEKKLQSKGTKSVNMKNTYINSNKILFGKLGGGKYKLLIYVYDNKNNKYTKTIYFEMAHNVKSFVNNLYYGMLGRAADDGGAAFWEKEARTYGAKHVIEAIYESAEFQNRVGKLNNTQFAKMMYYSLLGRAPERDGLNNLVNRMNGDRELDRREYFRSFYYEPEFKGYISSCGLYI